jgi:hypothetical protein
LSNWVFFTFWCYLNASHPQRQILSNKQIHIFTCRTLHLVENILLISPD